MNHMDIAPKYAGMVMGISNTAGGAHCRAVVSSSLYKWLRHMLCADVYISGPSLDCKIIRCFI